MPQCWVRTCGNYYGKTRGTNKIIYHMLPSNPVHQEKWLKLCRNQKNKAPSYARVCSDHFSANCYQRDLQHELLGLPLRKKLKPSAVPDRNLPKKDVLKTNNKTNENVKTIIKRKRNKLPMRSSIRIAKKKSIECLSDCHHKSTNKNGNFANKLKFMSKLCLKFERNENVDVRSPAYENDLSAGPARKRCDNVTKSLTKMQIMEEVREGCSVQPSSPGHAEEPATNEEEGNKTVTDTEENGFEEDNNCISDNNAENGAKVEEIEEVKEEKPLDNGGLEKPESNHVNEESSSSEETQNNKRKADNHDSSNKRLRLEIQENFFTRDKILNEFLEMSDCGAVEQLQTQSEQILAEIRTLNELAKEKEREWNNIIHLKKMKEELLVRMQRRKQVMLLNSDKNDNGDMSLSESQDSVKSTTNQSILKANLTQPRKLRLTNSESGKQRNLLAKPQTEINGSMDYKQKQRPILDVQSIIADYRQRHPETVPRRGRRIRGAQSDNNKSGTIMNFASLALGSGSQVHHNFQGFDSNSELGLLLNAMDSGREGSRPSSAESSTAHGNETSFKDMLVQFAKLSQSERNELIQNAMKPPPPYPEVTVHPVPTTTTSAPTNSLLHGILTKSPSKTKTSFSPTLARLLTAPERGGGTPAAANNLANSVNMSISEILSTSKARNEITITPVGAQYDGPLKNKNVTQVLEEDEAEDSADRLVIDESNEDGRGRGDNSSDGGDEVPQCQGCNQKSALFVCAGCGNQWYCSRDCQVSAWDEHSEVCSG